MTETFHEKETVAEYAYAFDGQELGPDSYGHGEWGPARVFEEAKAKANNAARALGFAPKFKVYRRERRTMVTEWAEVPNAQDGKQSCYDERTSSDTGTAS